MKYISLFFGAFLWATPAGAFQGLVTEIWPEGKVAHRIPSSETEETEQRDILLIRKVQVPTLEVFLPSGPPEEPRQAVLVLPGGGYQVLAYDWEGTQYGELLSRNGIVAAVLKYRLPSGASQSQPSKAPLSDAQRALRLLRSQAESWGVDPGRIGVMGFSAGGHLAASLSTRFSEPVYQALDEVDSLSARPDFTVLVYPVISFRDGITHMGSRNALLGERPEDSLIARYSADEQVTTETPPAFLVHAADDSGVPVANSLSYYDALLRRKIPASMHLFPEGGHGFSLAAGIPYLNGWTDLLIAWLGSLE